MPALHPLDQLPPVFDDAMHHMSKFAPIEAFDPNESSQLHFPVAESRRARRRFFNGQSQLVNTLN